MNRIFFQIFLTLFCLFYWFEAFKHGQTDLVALVPKVLMESEVRKNSLQENHISIKSVQNTKRSFRYENFAI